MSRTKDEKVVFCDFVIFSPFVCMQTACPHDHLISPGDVLIQLAIDFDEQHVCGTGRWPGTLILPIGGLFGKVVRPSVTHDGRWPALPDWPGRATAGPVAGQAVPASAAHCEQRQLYRDCPQSQTGLTDVVPEPALPVPQGYGCCSRRLTAAHGIAPEPRVIPAAEWPVHTGRAAGHEQKEA